LSFSADLTWFGQLVGSNIDIQWVWPFWVEYCKKFQPLCMYCVNNIKNPVK